MTMYHRAAAKRTDLFDGKRTGARCWNCGGWLEAVVQHPGVDSASDEVFIRPCIARFPHVPHEIYEDGAEWCPGIASRATDKSSEEPGGLREVACDLRLGLLVALSLGRCDLCYKDKCQSDCDCECHKEDERARAELHGLLADTAYLSVGKAGEERKTTVGEAFRKCVCGHTAATHNGVLVGCQDCACLEFIARCGAEGSVDIFKHECCQAQGHKGRHRSASGFEWGESADDAGEDTTGVTCSRCRHVFYEHGYGPCTATRGGELCGCPAYVRVDVYEDYDHHANGAECEGCNALWSHAYALGKKDAAADKSSDDATGGLGYHRITRLEAVNRFGHDVRVGQIYDEGAFIVAKSPDKASEDKSVTWDQAYNCANAGHPLVSDGRCACGLKPRPADSASEEQS